jgi:hypothetical protein
VGRRCRGAASI